MSRGDRMKRARQWKPFRNEQCVKETPKDLGDTTSTQKAKREADRQSLQGNLQGNLSDLFGPSSVVFKAKRP